MGSTDSHRARCLCLVHPWASVGSVVRPNRRHPIAAPDFPSRPVGGPRAQGLESGVERGRLHNGTIKSGGLPDCRVLPVGRSSLGKLHRSGLTEVGFPWPLFQTMGATAAGKKLAECSHGTGMPAPRAAASDGLGGAGPR